ncbi:hypothetical protein DRO53_05370 [Candidatus Bathyarchaeota archaeon]|nr:MAG: hypothetical protein DRO53_05370 [Candidatus Bathyarchaeota archaeon]
MKFRLPPALLALLMAALFLLWNHGSAVSLTSGQELGYVSDEVWYVSSSRNMLREFWGLTASSHEGNLSYATVTALSFHDYLEAMDLLSRLDEPYRLVKASYREELATGWPEAFALLASEESLKRLEQLGGLRVYRGYPYPDHDGILEYLNLEHPPLAKYILGLVLLADDRPPTWRIPSLLLGAAIVFLAYLTARKIFGELAGLAAALFAATDQTLRAMSMVAMLDIYLSFFTLLALYFALTLGREASALALGLAGSVKFSGFTPLLALLTVSFKNNPRKHWIILLPILTASVFLALSAPVIVYLGGFEAWIEKILWAMRWYATARPTGPPSTSPFGLLFGFNPFPLSFNPPLTATPNFLLTGMTIPLTLIFLPLALKGEIRGLGTCLAWFWTSYFTYLAVYLAGNTTLYTFYAVQFTPLAAVIGGGIVYLIFHPEKALEGLKAYLKLFRWAAGKPSSEDF